MIHDLQYFARFLNLPKAATNKKAGHVDPPTRRLPHNSTNEHFYDVDPLSAIRTKKPPQEKENGKRDLRTTRKEPESCLLNRVSDGPD
jgi:hypothetical protein